MNEFYYRLGNCYVTKAKNGSYSAHIPIAKEDGFVCLDDAILFIDSLGLIDNRIGNMFEKL